MFYLFIFFSTIIHCEASVFVFFLFLILFLGTIFYFSIILIRRSKKSTLQYHPFHSCLVCLFHIQDKGNNICQPGFLNRVPKQIPSFITVKTRQLFYIPAYLNFTSWFGLHPIKPNKPKTGIGFNCHFQSLLFMFCPWLMVNVDFSLLNLRLYFNGRTINILFLS